MKRRRSLSDEEEILWRKVTKNIQPIANDEDRVRGLPPSSSKDKIIRDRVSVSPRVSDAIGRASLKTVRKIAGKAGGNNTSVLGAGDPAVDKHVAKGRIEIERVLDLHGDTQIAAYPRLLKFLTDAFHDECRCVLVITGKGGPASASSMARVRSESTVRRDHRHRDSDGDNFTFSPPGILKQRFLEWIDTADLRVLIARVSGARPKDGGAGAFYVFLKKKKR